VGGSGFEAFKEESLEVKADVFCVYYNITITTLFAYPNTLFGTTCDGPNINTLVISSPCL
jgi:hypothetical protein